MYWLTCSQCGAQGLKVTTGEMVLRMEPNMGGSQTPCRHAPMLMDSIEIDDGVAGVWNER